MYKMKFGNLIFASLTAACVAFSAFAQGLPKAGQPEDVGFSSERLKRIASVFQGEVDKGVIPGAVILIARDGKVADFEAIGFQDREENTHGRGLNLPHCVHEQAAHLRRADDACRRGKDPA